MAGIVLCLLFGVLAAVALIESYILRNLCVAKSFICKPSSEINCAKVHRYWTDMYKYCRPVYSGFDDASKLSSLHYENRLKFLDNSNQRSTDQTQDCELTNIMDINCFI